MPEITMYSTTWCPYCRVAKRFFEEHQIEYTEVNVEEDAAAAEYVMEVNGGNRTVPTIKIEGVGVYTNPSRQELARLLNVGT